MSKLAPEDVYPLAVSELPEGAYLTHAIVLFEYAVPGADDPDERGPFLAYWRNTATGAIWQQIGMLRVMQDTLEADCQRSYEPGEEE